MDHGRNTPLSKEAVIVECIAQGITETEAVDIINKLIDDHLLKEPRQGFVQRT
jgi:transcriptional regulator CtsR